jgi:hypothetical protein
VQGQVVKKKKKKAKKQSKERESDNKNNRYYSGSDSRAMQVDPILVICDLFRGKVAICEQLMGLEKVVQPAVGRDDRSLRGWIF